jgi:murein DD-endopeptidase MepM/ murein hydrolase activator NlpD
VVDNPGFAPKYKKREGNDYEGDIFKNPRTGESFAVPTGIFGQWYEEVGRWHEGVDFRGEEGAPVYSLIHAKVVACGWTDTTYGQVVIFANENDKGMYMIAHLHEIAAGIEKGVSVSPGGIVGKVGGSAYENGEKKLRRWNPHLHVSYYDLQYDEASKDTGAYGKTDTDGNISFGGNALIGFDKFAERNPFWHASGRRADDNATNIKKE